MVCGRLLDMSMSTHVIGIRASTPEHKRMVAAWRANEAAGLDQPEKLSKYFNTDDSRAGFDVDLSKIPAGVTSLRFYNSW